MSAANIWGRTSVVWLIWFASFLVTYSLGTWLPTLYHDTLSRPASDGTALWRDRHVLSIIGLGELRLYH